LNRKRYVAFQGNVGSFSHRAAKHFAEITFSQYETSLVPCQSFGEVFEKIESSKEFYGAIPLENTSMGSIDANYDLLWTQSAIIVNEVFVPVHHSLITLPDADLNSIRQVYSHPAALDQCRRLFKTYPHMKAIPHWDTSASAILVREKNDPTVAAIASRKACEEQNLNILMANIEDYEHNATRFGLITKADNAATHVPTPYKVSVALELPNEPGSLAAVLTNFARCGVNLTSCKSRPEPGKPWHYRFFVDIEVANEEQHKQIYAYRKAFQYDVRLLGLYPVGTSAESE
jgi:prephenate dehydratase